MNRDTTSNERFSSPCCSCVTLAFFWLIRGFMQPIFWAVALGIVVYPLHARLAATACTTARRSPRASAS